jgi:hypothetical protein
VDDVKALIVALMELPARSRDSVTPSLLRIEGERVMILRHCRACPGHLRLSCCETAKTWMPGTRPGMTSCGKRFRAGKRCRDLPVGKMVVNGFVERI